MGSRIVGRRRELADFAAWLTAARGGWGRLVLCVGQPGIGKTRLVQEVTATARADGLRTAWGRCPDAEGAPPLWPWRQVLRALGVDPEPVLSGRAGTPEDRFRLIEDLAEILRDAADTGLLVVLDDIHRADEATLLVLRHIADQVPSLPLLLTATYSDAEPDSILPRALPALLSAAGVERLDLRGFDRAEVAEALTELGVDQAHADEVHRVTAGNPLFVHEVARAMADGSWRPNQPPRTVLDVVAGRLDRLTPDCARLVRAAAIAGRDFSFALVGAALELPMAQCLPLADEAIGHGLIERAGDGDSFRFVHSVARDAVAASLTTADRAALHRAVAKAIEHRFADDLTDQLADLARHWAWLAPYGESATARAWALRAADHAVQHLAYEEGVRLYRAALDFPAPWPQAQRSRTSISLGRAAYLAGDLAACADAAAAAMADARAIHSVDLMAEAALVLEPALAEHSINDVAERLCEEALAALGDTRPADPLSAVRARLLAQRSHLAFYSGDRGMVRALSADAIALARDCGEDRALVDAIRARQEACIGPAGRDERLQLASEMLAIARRTDNARTAMWSILWRIDALAESGSLTAAVTELGTLAKCVQRVGGPVSAWYLDRATACLAQAQGRFADAIAAGRRGFDRMRVVEFAAARGTLFALHCALAMHVGITEAGAEFVRHPFEPPPHFATLVRLHRAVLLLHAGNRDAAAVSYRQAGPPAAWTFPAFVGPFGDVLGVPIAIDLGRLDDVATLLDRLEPLRGEHLGGIGASYLGPINLCLGRAAAALGRLDQAIDDLTASVEQADAAAAAAFAAEARYHLALALLARNAPGDRGRAETAARDADRVARVLGMHAYTGKTATVLARLDRLGGLPGLSAREAEVADLVAAGLTNRQIAERLVIAERTAENHVQHILTKLGFSTRSQIAAWRVSSRQ